MDIEYKRNRVQEYLERTIDPSYSPTDDKTILKAFTLKAERYYLSSVDCANLYPLIKADAYDYTYSAAVSFFNALEDIYWQNYSWATVELYYVIYYLFRAKLHLGNIALFWARQLYYLQISPGESIKHSSDIKNNTHEGTISVFTKFFPSDFILTNTVDNINSVEWIKSNREIVNYRSVDFKDPTHFSYFDKFRTLILLKRNMKLIIDDPSTFAFQPEFAMVGLPLVLFNEIINDYSLDLKSIFGGRKLLYIQSKISRLDIGFINSYLTLK